MPRAGFEPAAISTFELLSYSAIETGMILIYWAKTEIDLIPSLENTEALREVSKEFSIQWKRGALFLE
jgi:hypothetical protein